MSQEKSHVAIHEFSTLEAKGNRPLIPTDFYLICWLYTKSCVIQTIQRYPQLLYEWKASNWGGCRKAWSHFPCFFNFWHAPTSTCLLHSHNQSQLHNPNSPPHSTKRIVFSDNDILSPILFSHPLLIPLTTFPKTTPFQSKKLRFKSWLKSKSNPIQSNLNPNNIPKWICIYIKTISQSTHKQSIGCPRHNTRGYRPDTRSCSRSRPQAHFPRWSCFRSNLFWCVSD